MLRLSQGAMDALPPDVKHPTYDRGALRTGIVHLGLGAFMRAHLAVMTEDAIEAGAGLHWGICGVSLRSPETRDALAPQQGLYTLALRDVDGEQLRVIGCARECLVAPENPAAVLARISSPLTRIVSLTVTEKGYHRDLTGGMPGGLNTDDADIAHDLHISQSPQAPRTAIGFIAHGLAQRFASGQAPITVMSLDNLPANGDTLRRLVLAFAEQLDPALAQWIGARCTFPNSMVDRIVPRTTRADRDAISAKLGQQDAWPVVAERFCDWAVEDHFAAGRPDWQAHGARFVSHAAPWEQLKLRMVNGAHSAIAYLALAAAWPTVDAAMAQPELRCTIQALLHDEIEPTLAPMLADVSSPDTPTFEMTHYRQQLLRRFANPALVHRCAQIAMDGSQKLPQRLLAPLRERLALGQPITLLALAVAAWLHHLRGHDDAGATYVIHDPLREPLQALHQQSLRLADDTERARLFTHFAPVFGDLAGSTVLISALAPWLTTLREQGSRAALQRLADNLRPRHTA